MTNWKACVSLSEGIDRTIDYFVNQQGIPMKILVIGGAGFLGANLFRRCLRDLNNQITVLDSLESAFTGKHR